MLLLFTLILLFSIDHCSQDCQCACLLCSFTSLEHHRSGMFAGFKILYSCHFIECPVFLPVDCNSTLDAVSTVDDVYVFCGILPVEMTSSPYSCECMRSPVLFVDGNQSVFTRIGLRFSHLIELSLFGEVTGSFAHSHP